MSKNRDRDPLVDEGEKLEKMYDWIAAVVPYRKALAVALKLDDFSKAAEICARIGLCHHRAAMQAKDQLGYRKLLVQALNAYDKATELSEKVDSPERLAKTCNCKAIAAYVSSWLKPDFDSRKKLLDECWKLGRKATRFYRERGDWPSLGRTCSQLSTYLVDRLNLEWDKQIREKILKEALSYGEEAIAVLAEQNEENELARAYYTTSIHYYTGASGLELEKKRKYIQKALNYSERAAKLSERIGDRLLLGMSNISLGSAITEWADDPDSAAKHFKNALQCGMETRDNLLIGKASYCLAALTSWKMVAEEDPEKRREESKKCEKYSEDAVRHFSLISNHQEIASSYCWYAENYNILAKSAETSWGKKRALLRKSIEAGRKGLEHARRSGSVKATWLILHPLSKSLFLLSTLETDIDVKKRLLAESLQHREENIKILQEAMPYYFWNHGVRAHYLALIQAEMADMEKGIKKRVTLLEKAVESAENCINLCSKDENLSREQYAALGGYYFDFGAILSRLCLTTGTNELQVKLLEAFKGAAETYEKAALPSRVSEGYWHLAKAHNKLQNYVESAESFVLANENYVLAAEKIPSLKAFYLNHASYMKGWSEIERARYNHTRQRYDRAKKHYEKAASLHKSSESWKYLASNYLAWAQLEHGEDLSRDEHSRRAIQAFRKAAGLFEKAKRTLQDETERIENADEEDLAKRLIKASDSRCRYCHGRIALEEAKILDRQGDHSASSRKYATAAKTFKKTTDAMERELDRQELRPIVYLCRAWQTMTQAEAEASPDLYLEASHLFDRAKEHSRNEKAKVLALGHSRFCKALEAGTRFEATRDTKLYSTASRHLESAADYYVKAGFKTATEYVKATQHLFDAYVYLDNAKKETDPEKKVRYCIMAEKVLKTSAISYMKAKYEEKSEQVQRLLVKVMEERELAASLSEVLHAPTITSSTASFTTPSPSEEKAVGLERFEHADIQASLIIRKREIRVGDDLNFVIEMVNAGNSPASLIMVEEIIPEGFEIKSGPEVYRVENCCIIMRGKRLDPLKTEELKLILQPTTKGTFRLKPRIQYLDETGQCKTHEPKSATITVKELGLKGWIRGR